MENSRDKMLACAAFVVMSCEYLKMKKKARRKRRWWVVPLHKNRTRLNPANTLESLRREPSGIFHDFCRMSATDFEHLLRKIGPMIERTDTNMRQAIPVQERLAVTLRFLSSGDSFRSLSSLFKFSVQTVSRSIHDVCSALNEVLADEIKMPSTSSQWLYIAKGFEKKWNFPNCVGAIDGKHLMIQSVNSGPEFTKYKGPISVVMVVIADASHCITHVDIGNQGRVSDGGMFRNAELFRSIEDNTISLPLDRELHPTISTPFVFIADDAFALCRHIMKPYPAVENKSKAQTVFNSRLLRALRVVENIFGVMGLVFRVLSKPMLLEPDRVSSIAMTCALLHNFLMRSESSSCRYAPEGTFDVDDGGEVVSGSWRENLKNVSSLLPVREIPTTPGSEAKRIRDDFAGFFVTDDDDRRGLEVFQATNIN